MGRSAGNPKPGLVTAGAALFLALAMLTLLATPQADAASRYKTVTRTFSDAQPIAIPEFGAAAPYPSEIPVAGFKRGEVLDANLVLKGFGQTHPADVDVMVSHRGVNRTVMSDVGFHYDLGGVTLRLDDEAAGPLPLTAPLAGGTFRPTNANDNPNDPEPQPDVFPSPAPAPSGMTKLSGFDGTNPNGPWQLWVVDDYNGYGGEFAGGWSVTIKARVPR